MGRKLPRAIREWLHGHPKKPQKIDEKTLEWLRKIARRQAQLDKQRELEDAEAGEPGVAGS